MVIQAPLDGAILCDACSSRLSVSILARALKPKSLDGLWSTLPGVTPCRSI